MSRLGVVLQESVSREREASRTTILWFLREQMDVGDEARVRRRSFKERLGFKGMGCCGATWGFRPPPTEIGADEEDAAEAERPVVDPTPVCTSDPNSDPNPGPSGGPGMNLAAALAAERQLRASSEGGETTAPATPTRVSLMRLLEETEGRDEAMMVRERSWGSDSVCCVCMGRKKGAAFIPCGHTYCRVCSRELWLNRGTCPLCNRPILEILDIF